MYISPNMYDFLGETFHMTFYPLWNIKEDILTSLEKEVYFLYNGSQWLFWSPLTSNSSGHHWLPLYGRKTDIFQNIFVYVPLRKKNIGLEQHKGE